MHNFDKLLEKSEEGFDIRCKYYKDNGLEDLRFAEWNVGFDENDINDARDYFQSYIDLNNSSDEIERLERKLKELKERKAELSKKVSECDKKEFFENLAKNGCEAVKKANEVLKENNLKVLRFGELNSCYKFLNRN